MIRVFEPSIYWSDYLSVLKTLRNKNISGTSPVVKEFEESFAKKFDRKFGIAVSNGSTALDLALQALNLEENDEVIVPSLTIISVLSAVLRTNATPVFADVELDTWNTSYEKIIERVTSKTKAVIIVHTYGLPVDMKKIQNLCNKKNIKIIEDTAEAHGQKYFDKFCGTFGDISTFSFYANKHVTTGEGGMLLTDNEDYAYTLKRMRNLDFDNKKRFEHSNKYWNYRIGGLQAGLGISQLKNINKTINKKISQGKNYIALLKNFEDLVQLPLTKTNYSENHFWVFGVVIKNFSKNQSKILSEELLRKGIETRPFFWPLHLQKLLPQQFIPNHKLSNSEYLASAGLYLPLGDHINKKKQEFIVSNLIEQILNVRQS